MKEKVMPIFLFITAALAITGCDNIFHDMKEDQFYPPATSLLYPGIEYTYPKDGATDMPINRQVLVSFSEDMDFTGLAGDEFSIVKEGDPLPITATITPYSKRILLISPASDLDTVSHYTVTLEKSLPGANGLVIPKGYSWSFYTIASGDNTPPAVVKITPPNKAVVGIFSMRTITIEFNEDMDPTTINNATVKLQKDGAVPVDINGDISYSVISLYGATHRMATFSPESSSIEGKADYILTISGVRDLAGNFLNPAPVTSHILTGINEVDLEDAQNINHGSASFGRNGNKGKSLLNSFGQYIEGLFADDVSMGSVFDTGTSGPLASGKSVRIVVGGKNILTGIGPGNVVLNPVKKELSTNLISPPGDQCYVDPSDGRFVLPRPLYWSKMEDWGNVTNPEIGLASNVPYIERNGIIDTEDSQILQQGFGNGLHLYCFCKKNNGVGTKNGDRSIYPLGDKQFNFSQGTVSAWIKTNIDIWVQMPSNVGGGATTKLYLVNFDHLKVYIESEMVYAWNNPSITKFETKLKWEIGDALIPSSYEAGSYDLADDTRYHIYAVWDSVKGLHGNSLRIFVNGDNDNALNSTKDLPNLELEDAVYNVIMSINTGATGLGVVILTSGHLYLDNLKIYNHVASEDPSWEYNVGAGREDALHPIYGDVSGYKPWLTTDHNSGVGYYH